MKDLRKNALLLCTMLILVLGCGSPTESDPESGPSGAIYLFGAYTNTEGDNPKFVVDTGATSEFIKYNGEPQIMYNPDYHDVTISLNNISIYGGGQNYLIDNLVIEEMVSGAWVEYAEFEPSYYSLTEIAVVLVLDVSSSLGPEFQNVKSYAKEFASIIWANMDQASIGAVAFASDLSYCSFTSSYGTFSSFINGLASGQYTRMYDAMHEGISMLQDSIADKDGYALVSFTDGVDNLSSHSAENIVSELEQSSIMSYTLGFEYEDPLSDGVLQNLAVHGEYRKVTSSEALQEAFEDFAKAVSNVYQVTYTRNDQIITQPRQLRYTLYVSEV